MNGAAATPAPAGGARLRRFPPSFRPLRLEGQRVLVVGLGTFGGGLGAVQHLLREGARVTVTDSRGPEALRESLDALTGQPLQFLLGRQPTASEVASADWIVASPAVPWTAPPLLEAAARGIPVESEITLLIRLLPCRWLGITGTNGKSTTTMLATRTLAATGRRVWGGGNLGGSLLDRWQELRADDAVVLEISSFQLEHLGEIGLGPDVALVTNVSHDHLDRHGTFAAYAEAKRQLLVRAGVALLQRGDATCVEFGRRFGGRVIWYGNEADFAPGDGGARLVAGRFGTFEDAQVDFAPLRLRGAHNRINLLAAASAATCFGVPFASAAAAGFAAAPLPRRLNDVAVVRNTTFIDDSVSTSPPAVAAALAACEGPIHLIAGGYDKGIDPEVVLQAMVRKCSSVTLYGAVGARVRALLLARLQAATATGGATAVPAAAGSPEGVLRPEEVRVATDLRTAFALAVARAGAGATVLYSPGYASYDQFRNFTERGDLFCALVAEHARLAGGDNSGAASRES
ncbi:MAG: UDP-N-acetylmuramoyl-L-alanine--D-glutamate ligase [Planctomycetes bacterium]|nr:UDP-N-acetylmuramoyl-L-alanine--D-glutamate ligase [Planctomycetota bacterium]